MEARPSPALRRSLTSALLLLVAPDQRDHQTRGVGHAVPAGKSEEQNVKAGTAVETWLRKRSTQHAFLCRLRRVWRVAPERLTMLPILAVSSPMPPARPRRRPWASRMRSSWSAAAAVRRPRPPRSPGPGGSGRCRPDPAAEPAEILAAARNGELDALVIGGVGRADLPDSAGRARCPGCDELRGQPGAASQRDHLARGRRLRWPSSCSRKCRSSCRPRG
jgi:hypothetical protein